MKSMSYPRNLQLGMTMIEVLIAIVVLSFGLLGILGMISNGLMMTTSSHYRTIAAQQLTAMAEKVRSNPDIVPSYAPPTAGTVTSGCLSTTGCGATANLANSDYQLWLNQLDALLPPLNAGTAKGVVCLDSTPGDGHMGAFACETSGRVTIKICWNESQRIGISGGGVTGQDNSTDTCLSTQL